jgi:hypothetical protein
MEPAPGQHPSLSTASNIVLGACSEIPNANSASVIGTLYPLSDARTLFRQRIIDGASAQGFRITQGQIPTGDTTTLGQVTDAVCQNAVS